MTELQSGEELTVLHTISGRAFLSADDDARYTPSLLRQQG